MTQPTIKEIVDFYVAEFTRHTLAMDAPNAKIDYYRLDPNVRVCRSDLAAKFEGVDWVMIWPELHPQMKKAERLLKRRGLWRMSKNEVNQ